MIEEKIKRFLNDIAMSEAVKRALMDSFLKPKGTKDVQVLAAERIAIELLEEAWKNLRRYAAESEKEARDQRNPGV